MSAPYTALLATALAAAAMACDPPVVQGPPPPAPGAARARGGAAAATPATPVSAGAASNSADGGAPRPPPLALRDGDFTETDRTRDPFRSFAQEFVPVGPQERIAENEIKLRQYAIDELHLIAVVLGSGAPYAMVIDPTGRGTIIRRGEYVGRPDTVAGGPEGAAPHQVPWRVARIAGSRLRRAADSNLTEIPGEVVFEREDRLNPSAAHAERVLALNPREQAGEGSGPGNTPPVQPSGLPAFPAGPGGSSPFLPALPPTGRTGPGAASPPSPNGATYVQSYTTVVPGQPAAQAPPTTVVIQTGPQGQTVVSGSGQGQPAAAPSGPRDPYAPPAGGSSTPPPVQFNSGPSAPSAPLPQSGLPR